MKGEPTTGYVTDRERDVWALIALGRTSKEIAADLGIGLRCVDKHRDSVRRKVGARNTADMVRKAVEHGVIAVRVCPLLRSPGLRKGVRHYLAPLPHQVSDLELAQTFSPCAQ